MTPDAAVSTAARVGSADVPTILALAVLIVGSAAVWLVREVSRLNRELLASESARRSDTERLLTNALAREASVVGALDAIEELPAAMRALPDAVASTVCARMCADKRTR